MKKNSLRLALLRLFALSLVLTWGQFAFAQNPTTVIFSGFGDFGTETFSYTGTANFDSFPSTCDYWTSTDGHWVLIHCTGIWSTVSASSQNFYQEARYWWNDADGNFANDHWNDYGGAGPVGTVTTGPGFNPMSLYPTNNVYIIGGTNSTIIINDGTHPVPSQFITTVDDWLWFSGGWTVGLLFGGIAFCYRLARQTASSNPDV